VEGTTENVLACGRLVAEFVERGLDAERGMLLVIDGGKALPKANRAAFGRKLLIQPCRRHCATKERDVPAYLAEADKRWQHGEVALGWTDRRQVARRRRPSSATSRATA
jgi:putative transposase